MVASFPCVLELCGEAGASDPWLGEKKEDQVRQDPIKVAKETSYSVFPN